MSNERAEIDQPFSRQLHADTHPLHEVGPPHVGVVDVDRFPIPHPDLDLSRPALVIAQDRKHPVSTDHLDCQRQTGLGRTKLLLSSSPCSY